MRTGVLAALAVLIGASGPAPAQDVSGLDAYPVTRERPLFSPTRRAPPTVRLGTVPEALPLPVTPPPPLRPNLQLSGVIVGGGQGVALVRRAGDARPISVGIGATIDGWTVSEIAPRAITLRRDALSAVVTLPEPGQ